AMCPPSVPPVATHTKQRGGKRSKVFTLCLPSGVGLIFPIRPEQREYPAWNVDDPRTPKRIAQEQRRNHIPNRVCVIASDLPFASPAGDMIVVRYAADFIVGFQHRAEAEKFLAALRQRFAKFGLQLHPDKTRLIEFGRFAAENRRKHGQGKQERFDFLGFTHICTTKRSNGYFTVLRQTIAKRLQAKLAEVKAELKRRMHDTVPAVGKWLASVIDGHCRYYGVPVNAPALWRFRFEAIGHWRGALCRRSQTGRITWGRMKRLVARYLPVPRIYHPYPLRRLGVIT
ncbi:MAG: reverse transcriptase domain-containing protein, partial [Phycisphaerae bacterium]